LPVVLSTAASTNLLAFPLYTGNSSTGCSTSFTTGFSLQPVNPSPKAAALAVKADSFKNALLFNYFTSPDYFLRPAYIMQVLCQADN
jgi:hypothetical protein